MRARIAATRPTTGTQNWTWDLGIAQERLAGAFGAEAASEITKALGAGVG